MSYNLILCLVALAIFIVGRWSLWLMERPKKIAPRKEPLYDTAMQDFSPAPPSEPIRGWVQPPRMAQSPARYMYAPGDGSIAPARPYVPPGQVGGYHDAGNPMTGMWLSVVTAGIIYHLIKR